MFKRKIIEKKIENLYNDPVNSNVKIYHSNPQILFQMRIHMQTVLKYNI